uniref:Uncharacterized protein n=1 Tax=Oryzias melastigma TaxID=30732 RepID=A0A3B3CCE6_ORYME
MYFILKKKCFICIFFACSTGKAVLIGGGGVAAVVLTPAVIAALGFSATGIVAGSIAAKLMALLSGGWPGLIALLQSFGTLNVKLFNRPLTFGWLKSVNLDLHVRSAT